jgi:heme o synthase
VPAASAALGALLVAIALGGVVAWSGNATWAVALHVGGAAVALGLALVVVLRSLRGDAASLASLRDYLTLTKPRIMTLLLLTGAAGMFVGAQGVPPLGRFAVTMVGLALACGGASALNHVLDRDIDVLMGSRTKERPVASGRVSPEQALEFGILLSAVSFALLASAVNVLTAVLALVGNLFYVLVYTRWLKRSTPQNIVIGGAAGAVPPLVGYAAATGSLALPALWLFLIVFLWTPPHFWALALMIKNAYAAAGVPMLPVVRGDRETARQIVLYSFVMVAFTVFVGLWLGALYTVAALVLGAVFIALSLLLRRDLSRAHAKVLFHYSLLYLALLFAAAALDPVLL